MPALVTMAGKECRGAALLLLFGFTTVVSSGLYHVDTTEGLGRRFDGIGGLSGGGATSKLLINYAEPYRSQILDYLFKPNFGASLQILKVEIGGDGQSTDGTEASHMHEPWDEAYNRGYEWWLMLEAKKRNPSIKLYGLPWTFPGWVAMATQNPFTNATRTAHYLLKWVQGAKKYHNLDINYIGIWNERHYDKQYIKVLRQVLDQNGFSEVQIVAADSSWFISADILKDPEFAKAISIIGAHYPGTNSSKVAQMTNKPLWSSEDYSTFNDNVGGGCWARILNQNYVNGLMTSTISWNLIASYYQDLPFGRDGLMTAQEPWSGHYVVESPILITAHTTHFVNVGWYYLSHGAGVGHLNQGGSYVSLTDKRSGDLTIIIETMSHNHSICIRPFLPTYSVEPQTATFFFKGQFSQLTKLYVWHSRLYFDGRPNKMFVKENPVKVIKGRLTVRLDVDEVYTLTTVDRQPPELYPQPPSSKPFPLPYTDDFEGYPVNGESFNFVPQIGVWEIRNAESRGHGKVNRQVMLHDGCYWCNPGSQPINLGGNYNWTDVLVSLDVYIPVVNGTDGVFLGARVTRGGCHSDKGSGIFFGVHQNTSTYVISMDFKMTKVIKSGSLSGTLERNSWYNLRLAVVADKAQGFFNNKHLVTVDVPSAPANGFVAYGATSYGIVDYDNLVISQAPGHRDLWRQRTTNGTWTGHGI